MLVKMGSSSPSRGENKKYLKPPPRCYILLYIVHCLLLSSTDASMKNKYMHPPPPFLHLVHPPTLATEIRRKSGRRLATGSSHVENYHGELYNSTLPHNQRYKPITKSFWITLPDFPCLSSSWESKGPTPQKKNSRPS